MSSVRVPGFRPSTSGLRFANAFPPGPVLAIRAGALRLGIGNASDGLCGGMIFAVRDLFERNIPPPPDRRPPSPGTPLFRYLVRRLIQSFALPLGPLRYFLWMALPDADLFAFGVRVPGLLTRTVESEWPRVRADLDSARLSPLGLVRMRSLDPFDLGRNHQVLAYGYDLDEGSSVVRLLVYDPNHPGEDELALSLPLRAEQGRQIGYVAGELPVRGFFRTKFRSGDPRRLRQAIGASVDRPRQRGKGLPRTVRWVSLWRTEAERARPLNGGAHR